MAENTIDSLNIEITVGVNSAVKAIQTAKRNLTGLQKIIDRVNELQFNSDAVKTFTESMEKVSSVCGGAKMDKAIANIEKLTKLKAFKVKVPEIKVPDTQSFEDIKKITDAAADAYNSRMRNLRTSGPVGEGGTAPDWRKIKRDQAAFEEYINVYTAGRDALGAKTKRNAAQFDELAKRAWDASERFKQAYDKIAYVSETTDMLPQVDEIPKKVSRITQVIERLNKRVGETFANIRRSVSESGSIFGKIKESLYPRTHKRSILDKLGQRLLFMGVYKTINMISQALKEGTDNLYQYSKAMNGSFASSMDSMSSSMLYLKNSIAAAAAPLIETLSPAIDFIVDKIVAFSNVLNQLFAKLSGASTWTKATRIQKEYADELKDTADAAKKALNILVGFDELNIFNPVSSNTSSSKFTGANPDPKTMFETMDISTVDENIAAFAEKISDAFEKIKKKFEEVKEKVVSVMDMLGIDFDDLLDAALTVGGAILAWKLSTGFLSSISSLISTVQQLKIPISIGLSIVGLKLLSDNLDTLLSGQGDWKNVLGAAIGAALNIGALTWAFGSAGLALGLATTLELTGWKLIKDAISRFRNGEEGWKKWLELGIGGVLSAAGIAIASAAFGPAGFIISLGTMLALAVTSFNIDFNEQYWNSEIGKKIKAMQDNAKETYDYSVNLMLEINSIDAPIKELESKFTTLRALVDEAFNINDIAVADRTSSEALRLKALVNEINNMGIIQLNFDENGSIKQTRADTEGLIGDTLRYYQTLAYQEAYVEAYKKNAEAVRALKKAQDDLNAVNKQVRESQQKAYDSMSEAARTTKNYSEATDVTTKGVKGFILTLEAWVMGLLKGEKELKENIKTLEESEKALDEQQKAYESMKKATEESTRQVEYYSKALEDLNKTDVDISLKVDTRQLDNAIDKLEASFQVNAVAKGNAKFNTDRYQAMADGGVAYRPTQALIGEYSGASSNPEIVSPQDLMYETMVRANADSNTATEALLRKLLRAVEEGNSRDGNISVTVTSSEINRAQERYDRRVGAR
jgi:hypothetical protein